LPCSSYSVDRKHPFFLLFTAIYVTERKGKIKISDESKRHIKNWSYREVNALKKQLSEIKCTFLHGKILQIGKVPHISGYFLFHVTLHIFTLSFSTNTPLKQNTRQLSKV
jgi:hypothetical protein